MEDLKKSLCIYVAYLRCLYLIHQNNHWTCKGKNFYQYHLLFERLYSSAQSDADMAAEKIVGLYGSGTLSLAAQSECIGTILTKLKPSADDLVKLSLDAELAFAAYSEKLYGLMKAEKSFSLGMDNMMMSIYDRREEARYLLSQSLDSTD